jgi:hypothetical protein
VVPDPTIEEIKAVMYAAGVKDLPVLVEAAREGCIFLTTFNVRHFQPGLPGVTVLKPGDLVLRVRYLLSHLKPGPDTGLSR